MNGSRAWTTAEAEACTSLPEVRAGIDEVDVAIVELLARRLTYAVRASELKTDRAQVRNEARIAQIIANAVARGAETGVPSEIVEPIWRTLLDRFDEHALVVFEAMQAARFAAENPDNGRGGAA